MPARTLIIAALLALLPSLADAQSRPQTRDGFWFNGGLGFGSAGCDGCNRRQSALTVSLGVGGTFNRKVLLGASIDTWNKLGTSLTVVLARLRFYPSPASGFFLTAGLGLGMMRAVATGANRSDAGTGGLLGLGYDIRVSPNVSLTPFVNGFSTGELETNHNVGQLGLSLTVH